MTEVDALDWYEDVANGDKQSEEYLLENKRGGEIRVEVQEIDRSDLLDQITKLPNEMLETLAEAEDEDDAQEVAEEKNMLSNVNGDTISAFERICVLGLEHEQYTQEMWTDVVSELSFEVLFEVGSKVIELTFEDAGAVEGFRKAD